MDPDEQPLPPSDARLGAIVDAQASKLNVALHVRLMREGGAKPSSLASAMAALDRVRRRRDADDARTARDVAEWLEDSTSDQGEAEVLEG
jgi:hypothetical protein